MEPAGSRIPAWKRLGLKLKHADQSDNQLSRPHEHQNGGGHPADASYPRGETVDGRRQTAGPAHQRLGKRKHGADPAERTGEARKKSRKAQERETPNGAAGDIVSVTPKQENIALNPVPGPASAADASRPKGDPNYRKKKKGRRGGSDGPNFGQKELPQPDHRQQSVDAQSPKNSARTPSLSPSQPDLANYGGTLLVSTETDHLAAPPLATTPKPGKTTVAATEGQRKSTLSSSPSRTDRRKSVTFTPDTKTTDGSSTSSLFKKWVQEQKGPGAEFTPAEVAQFVPPPKSHPANGVPAAPAPTVRDKKRAKRAKEKSKAPLPDSHSPKEEDSSTQKLQESTTEPGSVAVSATPKSLAAATSRPKKDFSRFTLYLTEYHTDRANWKFNKAKQNDVLDNALNVFRIPEEHSEALFEYVKGLKGAGVMERLRSKCKATLEQTKAADEQEMSTDAEARKAAQEEALQERLAREKNRRQLEGDIENMLDHPYTEGYIRRLKRRRAEALLNALNLAAPAQSTTRQTNGVIKQAGSDSVRPMKMTRKRKLREVSSSGSSSDSSSSSEESSSSSESESEPESGGGESSSSSDSDSDSASSGSSRDKENDNESSNAADSASEGSAEGSNSASESGGNDSESGGSDESSSDGD